MHENDNERFVRWQDYRIKQFSDSIKLFLAFAVASLGFAINAKLEAKGIATTTVDSIIVWWAVSALFGTAATIVRLLDFRYTALKIRKPGTFNSAMAKHCGPISWGLFGVQVVSYAVGCYIFVVGTLSS